MVTVPVAFISLSGDGRIEVRDNGKPIAHGPVPEGWTVPLLRASEGLRALGFMPTSEHLRVDGGFEIDVESLP